MKKFTITQFAERFPNDAACLHHLFRVRYGNLTECPECTATADFKRVAKRRSYQCTQCGFQIYPTQGTVFEKTTTPLMYWFTAIYLFTTTRNGVAAKELERQFAISYPTALRMAHQLKKLIANATTQKVMTGIVELDEAYLGGRIYNMHKHKREKLVKNDNKVAVLGMLERKVGVRLEIIENAKAETVHPILRESIAPEAIVMTDQSNTYDGINKYNFKHYRVNHAIGEYARGLVSTNGIEAFWAQVRRTITATHIQVSRKHLQKYLNECAFRYNHRDKQDEMFDTILNAV
jgi:transposase